MPTRRIVVDSAGIASVVALLPAREIPLKLKYRTNFSSRRASR